jgi:MFS transporter, DHA1 family, tetracycline resistance protein
LTSRRSPLLPIFLIVLVDILGLTIILPLLPFYAQHFGASATVVGMLASSYALCQLIAGPILGAMSDRMGRRKPLLIVSQVGTFIGFLILASANSLAIVFLARVVDGLTAGNLSLAQAYIADVTEPQNRAKSFAVIGIAFGVGFLIGPAISGFLSQYGYTYPILAAAALSAGSVLCTATLLPKVEPRIGGDASGPGGKRLGLFEWSRYGEYFVRPGLGSLLQQFFFFAFSFSLFMGGFALYAQQRYQWNGHPVGAKEIGYVFAYVGLLGVILQGGFMGRLVKKFGERTLVWTGFGSAGLGYGLMAWTNTLPQLLGACTVNSYGMGVLRPSLTALITHKAGKDEQGVVLGLTQSITSICYVIAPIIAGELIDRHLLGGWALLTAAFAIAGMFLSLARRND